MILLLLLWARVCLCVFLPTWIPVHPASSWIIAGNNHSRNKMTTRIFIFKPFEVFFLSILHSHKSSLYAEILCFKCFTLAMAVRFVQYYDFAASLSIRLCPWLFLANWRDHSLFTLSLCHSDLSVNFMFTFTFHHW